jgi:hypothetical protein
MSVQGFHRVAGKGQITSRRSFLPAFGRYEHFLHEPCRWANYYSDSQLAQSNVTGPSFLAFFDQPSALPGNVTFNAQTSLVSLSLGVPLITISWGYQLNGTAITLLSLTYFYPSK